MPARLLIALTVFVAMLAATAVAAAPPGEPGPFPYAAPEEVGLSSEKLDRIGDAIGTWVAQGDVIGAELLIVKDDKAVFHEVYGWSDREERRPLQRGAIWSIKSMSKPFTAAAILMLAEEGRLSLDDRVRQYVPQFAGDERTTIRNLLTHTTGYAGLGDTAQFTSLGEWVEDWGRKRPEQPYGKFSYSDFNYAALGHIVERVSGRKVDRFIEERIVGPLGLRDTHATFSPDAPWAKRVSSRYTLNSQGTGYEKYWTNRQGQGWFFYPAAWGLWSTAMDYARFLTMWMDGGKYGSVRLLDEGSVNEALKPQEPTGHGGFIGYGWFVNTAPRMFTHSGYDGTMGTSFPDDDAMVILLTHSRGREHQGALFNRLGMLGVFEHPGPMAFNLAIPSANVKEIAMPSEERARYAGTYRGPGGEEGRADMVARVREDGGRLHLSMGNLADSTYVQFHLVPVGDHRFKLGQYRGDRLEGIDPDATLVFDVGNGKANAARLVAEDETLMAGERADPDRIRAEEDRILAERWKASNRVGIEQLVLQTIDSEGIEAARLRHRALHASAPESLRFEEGLLNALGYRLMREGRLSEAIAVFEMNVEAYPNAPNPHDSLAEAYFEAGRIEEGVRSQERAATLGEEQKHPNREAYRMRLEQAKRRLKEK